MVMVEYIRGSSFKEEYETMRMGEKTKRWIASGIAIFIVLSMLVSFIIISIVPN